MNNPRKPNFGDRFDDEPERTLDENELRGPSEFLKSIGPEDEDLAVIEDGLEAYGFDQINEDVPLGETNMPSDMPGWMNHDALERSHATDMEDENGVYEEDEADDDL